MSSLIRSPARPRLAIIARRPEALEVRTGLGLELDGGVEQCVELVDLEKGPRRSRSLEEPCGAAADVNTAHYRLAKIAERTDCDLRRVSDLIEILIAARLADAAARDAAS